jgi:hypothetical protein
MKKTRINLLAAGLCGAGLLAGFTSVNQLSAQTFDITFDNGAGVSGNGEITAATDDGGGVFTATSGTFSFSGITFELDPVPAGFTDVTIHGIGNTSGADLFGDNKLGNGFISNDGLIFTSPQANGNVNGFDGDVVNLWGNGGDSYTLAFAGPDFPFNVSQVNGQATITPAPEPATLALSSLGGLGVLLLRRRR